MSSVFQTFDCNTDGQISRSELALSMTKFGKELNAQDLDEIMDLHDLNKDGFIDASEFMKMLGYTGLMVIPEENKVQMVYK